MPLQSWRYAWYESETPESIDMPCGYKDTASVVPEFESNVMGMIPKLGQPNGQKIRSRTVGEGGLVQASLDHSQH